jgi:hypothetical protein
METKNYYPLRAGNESDQLVSDVPTRQYENDLDRETEVNMYGGHFAGESIIRPLRDQLILAYNEKYGPKEQGVIDNELQTLMFEHKKNIQDGPTLADTLDSYKYRLHRSFAKINDYIMDKYFNSAHSFTEGSDVTPLSHFKLPSEKHAMNNIPDLSDQLGDIMREKLSEEINTPTIDEQIRFVDDSISRIGGSNIMTAIKDNLMILKLGMCLPGYAGKIDVEKVIEDLVHFSHHAVKNLDKTSLEEYDFPKLHDALMNAEAALGMLQAFKGKRGHIGTTLEKKVADVTGLPPLKDGRLLKIQYSPKSPEELQIRNKLRSALPVAGMVGQDERMMTANAIMNAIDEMIKLRGL